MNGSIDLNRFWGTQLVGFKFEQAFMSLHFELFWTIRGDPKRARINFEGVSSLNMRAERIFSSESVELISLEACVEGNSYRVTGELSTYEFAFTCLKITEG